MPLAHTRNAALPWSAGPDTRGPGHHQREDREMKTSMTPAVLDDNATVLYELARSLPKTSSHDLHTVAVVARAAAVYHEFARAGGYIGGESEPDGSYVRPLGAAK